MGDYIGDYLKNWVVVKERNASYYDGGPYYLLYVPIILW